MVKLGDEVKDKVSGFKGVVVSEHNYLNGCQRLSVQPKVTKEGKLPNSQTFDEPQLELIKKKKIAQGSRFAGGPTKFMDEGR